ncbi:MAG: hypothetical protein H0W61_00045 [Bacteroidetes bacterium]|nr:hypothetical protein [Bacteroidota bacterium]
MIPAPIKENENVGFHYTVSDEQIKEHQKKTVEEIVNWVESTAKFIYDFQSPGERERMRKNKNFK